MTYSNPFFLFFMAMAIYIYALSAPRYRSGVLLLASLAWYWTWGPFWCLLLFLNTALNYVILHLVGKHRPEMKNNSFIGLIIFNIILLIALKAFPLLFPEIPGPSGVSFYFFSLLGFLIDQKRAGTKSIQLKFSEFLLFPSFFAALLAGPVIRSKNFAPQLQSLKNISLADIVDGSLIFFYGYFKLQFLTAPLAEISTQLFLNYRSDHPYFWLACLVATFRAYIEFSSYCDMGRGAAQFFGIKLAINFKAFYYAKSPNDFWSRWNISLGEWIRDYLSFPLMLKFGKKINQSILIIVSFILVGLWHGLSINWVYFGLFNGLLVAVAFILTQKMAKSAGLVSFINRILSWILFIGNGILARNDFLQLLSLNRNVAEGFKLQNNAYAFAVALGVLLLFEYIQEKKKNLDFYLAWPQNLKSYSALALLVLFLFKLSDTLSSAPNLLPPLYFKF